ncbi:hypothetical protein AAU57_10440 [Nonlabens sp. YIK11]|uniref:hypothetical protein n=1 Tax=Nonlabens sp. YIK11 TaxID=1453349 RepID=UPI0006DCF476|nr:hypothetical protein [Nonlabens sp. YIK11]KQC33699.1 hypothetical protein AAU57_10440 [Nonlabens sp. YIK11]
MKKLSTLLAMLFLGFGMASAEKPADDDTRYRGYSNSFIFTEGGIEFAVFPDGQFDFNFLDYGPRFGANVNIGNVNVSFNTGYDYDPYVQYDTYGAVIQIENTPIYYDAYGRIIQAGDVFINYNNGYVRNIGNLYVNYSRPGVILNYTGFINVYNRNYVYQPWHGYYAAPFVDRVVVYNRPYRAYYNPIRFSYAYHRNYWNTPTYYNGCYIDNRVRRSFYRPYDRVVYRDYERGRRDNRGRAISNSRSSREYRNSIASGRQSIFRNDNFNRQNSRSIASNSNDRRSKVVTPRNNDRSTRAISNTRSTAGNSRGVFDNRQSNTTRMSTSRPSPNVGITGRSVGNVSNSNRTSTRVNTNSRVANERKAVSTRSNTSTRVSQPQVNRSTRPAVKQSSNRTSTRSSGNTQRQSTRATSSRSSRPEAKSTSQRSSRSSGNTRSTSSNRRSTRG